MSLSKYPSKLSLPLNSGGAGTVLDYLIARFPGITGEVWKQRVTDGKVHWHDGSLVSAESAYQPQQRVYYYREVEREPVIPFAETVLYHDDHILVADKPHFLPVTPGGAFVNECLQNRLRRGTGLESLQAVHRLDRATAGVVLFSVNPDTRDLYHKLFSTRGIEKTYHAIAMSDSEESLIGRQWVIKKRLVRADPGFLMKVADGDANSHSEIRCLQQSKDKALFELQPITGKTHQLRLHMQTLGWPILNDNFYPELKPDTADDFSCPLQLLASKLRFIDPMTKHCRSFNSSMQLHLD